MTIGLALLAAIAQTFVVTFRIIHKNQVLNKALTNTRLIQEHITRELSGAISQTSSATDIRPITSGDSSTFSYADPHTGSTVTYTYRSKLTYRIPIGSLARAKNLTTSGSSSIIVTQIGDGMVEVGDYLMISNPNSGKLLKINSISGTLGTAGDLTLGLNQTIVAAQTAALVATKDIPAGTTLTIQRERAYDVVAGSNGLYELRWYANTSSASYVVLSTNIDPNFYQLFSRIESTSGSSDTAIKWRLSYLASSSERAPIIPGGQASFYQKNYSEGLILPKSGNPISTSSYAATALTAYSGLYTTTAGTTTAATTTSGTTTAGSTTTSGTTTSGTTTAGTSTTARTTTAGSTTTSGTTTLGTTTGGSTTSLGTTTSGTTTSGTTTAGTSTTARTTTNGSTTTLGTTTLGTTTLGSSSTTSATSTMGTTTIRFDG